MQAQTYQLDAQKYRLLRTPKLVMEYINADQELAWREITPESPQLTIADLLNGS